MSPGDKYENLTNVRVLDNIERLVPATVWFKKRYTERSVRVCTCRVTAMVL